MRALPARDVRQVELGGDAVFVRHDLAARDLRGVRERALEPLPVPLAASHGPPSPVHAKEWPRSRIPFALKLLALRAMRVGGVRALGQTLAARPGK